MYGNNPYMRNFNQQNIYEQIDSEINNLQQMKERMKNQVQQPAINQTFQLAPTNNHAMRYANTIDDVNKEIVYFETPFFSKDMSVMWLKNVKGEIKTYELKEIVEKDEKDIQIELLMAKISELEKEKEYEQHTSNVNESKTTTNTPKFDEPTREQFKKEKSTSVQKISGSKEK